MVDSQNVKVKTQVQVLEKSLSYNYVRIEYNLQIHQSMRKANFNDEVILLSYFSLYLNFSLE